MRVRNQRIDAFLSWCAGQVKKFERPISKGTLSKHYVADQKLKFQPYYFSIYAPDEVLAQKIQESSYNLEVKAKLMCLLSLPINSDFFKILSKSATIKLDKYRRIIKYDRQRTHFQCTHKKPRNPKMVVSKNDETDEEMDEDDEFSTPDTSRTTPDTPILIKSENDYGPVKQEPLDIEDPFHRPPSETPSTFNMESFSKDNTPEPEEAVMVKVLQKMEYFFLDKCKEEFSPLCERIKAVRENAGKREKKTSKSTIKSFFEVSLRLMVAENPKFAVKTEPGTHNSPILLMDFLEELKNKNLVEGLENMLENLQEEIGKDEIISYYTISKTFYDLVNNLEKIC